MMAQKINAKKIDERTVVINGATIAKDMDDKWVTNRELTKAERFILDGMLRHDSDHIPSAQFCHVRNSQRKIA